MNSPSQPPAPDRRRFLVTVGVAGLSQALMPSMMAIGQTPTPPPVATPAKPDSAAAPATPAAPPEISEEARALAAILQRRYGKHLTPEQLEAVTTELEQRLAGGRALRGAKLANGDEPDFTFRL